MKRAENISRYRILINGHWRSDRGTILVEASFESRCRMLLTGSGAYQGLTI